MYRGKKNVNFLTYYKKKYIRQQMEYDILVFQAINPNIYVYRV